MTLLLLFDGLHLRSTSYVKVKSGSVLGSPEESLACHQVDAKRRSFFFTRGQCVLQASPTMHVVASGWTDLHLRSLSTLSA